MFEMGCLLGLLTPQTVDVLIKYEKIRIASLVGNDL